MLGVRTAFNKRTRRMPGKLLLTFELPYQQGRWWICGEYKTGIHGLNK